MAARVLVVGAGSSGSPVPGGWPKPATRSPWSAPDPGRDGASWVAAGMLAPVTEVQFGEAPLTELLLEGAAAWKEFATSLERASGHDVGYDESGTLTVALDASDRAALDQLLAYQHSLGCTAHRRTASECRALVPSLTPTLRGGIEVPGDHHVDNRALLGALVQACRAKGVRFVPRTVEAVSAGSGAVGPVRVGRSGCGRFRMAAASAPTTSSWRPGPVRPTSAVSRRRACRRSGRSRGISCAWVPQMGRRDPPLLPRTVRALVHGRSIYLVPRPDRTVVVGATMEERGHDLTVRAGAVHELLGDARAVVPGIDELELLEARTGLRPATPDNTPVVGWTALPGVAVASGHFRNGMLLAPLTAATVVDLFGRGWLRRRRWSGP